MAIPRNTECLFFIPVTQDTNTYEVELKLTLQNFNPANQFIGIRYFSLTTMQFKAESLEVTDGNKINTIIKGNFLPNGEGNSFSLNINTPAQIDNVLRISGTVVLKKLSYTDVNG